MCSSDLARPSGGSVWATKIAVCRNGLKHNGVIMAVKPKMSVVLAMLLPNTFPQTISGCWFMLAIILIISSGADVPNATRDNPMINGDTR